MPTADEEIWGTWVNLEHSGGPYYPQKVINHYWRSIDTSMRATDRAPSFKAAHTLVDKWTDREGNVWYKPYWPDSSGPTLYYEIDRVSKGGKVFEFCFDTFGFPSEGALKSKSLAYKYRIFYRQ